MHGEAAVGTKGEGHGSLAGEAHSRRGLRKLQDKTWGNGGIDRWEVARLSVGEVSRRSDACGMASMTIVCHRCPKTLSGLSRRSGRCEVRGVGDESCSVRVHGSSCLLPVSLPVRSRFAPGFTPGSLPVLLPIPDPPQSHSITLIQTDFLVVSMRTSFPVTLHLT